MSLQSEILKKEFERLSADLTAKYNELGMRASGDWEKGKTVDISERGTVVSGKIEGLDYTEQLQFGRKPGRFPPIDAIEKWISDKGIATDIPIRSLAFLIARKIANEGTKYFRQGGTDLIDSVITPERIDDIISQVGIINVEGIVDGFVKELKEVAA